MNIEVIKFDNSGRGIGYLDNKIIFIPKSVPGDIVLVKITKDKKNYLEGSIVKIIKPSKLRKEAICPYFNLCGGCDLMHISLTEELEYKLTKINDILRSKNIDYQVKDIIKSDREYAYRNKITLKVIKQKIGYYLSDSHELLEIKKCYLVNDAINNLITDLPKLSIINGEITIRCNYKNELLIIIKSTDTLSNIDYFITQHNIVGIIQNNKCIYGEDFFFNQIQDLLFKVSYDAFFQVNDNMCEKLFNLIRENTLNQKKILDLYCGVGTLSLVSSLNSDYTLGIEINENAIKDALINKVINKIDNAEFICSDTKNILNQITNDYDVVILDPPRSGVDANVLKKIMEQKIKTIIYVSCNPFTLVRDLNILKEKYTIKDIKLLDMFVWSEHVESFCVLNLR